jgi:hypothetical protein
VSDAVLTVVGFVLLAWVLGGPVVGGYLGARLALRICSEHWQCPIATRRQAEEWTRRLEEERGT